MYESFPCNNKAHQNNTFSLIIIVQFIKISIGQLIIFLFIPPCHRACFLHLIDKNLYNLHILCYTTVEVININNKTIEKTSTTKLSHKPKTYENEDLIFQDNLIYDSAQEYLNNYTVN